MKNLLICGFPCSSESWDFLQKNQDIIFISPLDFLKKNPKTSIRDMAKTLAELILSTPIHTIYAHDLGVTLTLLALFKIRNKQKSSLPENLILFNGIFDQFDVFQNPHPFFLQFLSWSQMEKIFARKNITYEKEYKHYLSSIKRIYREIIFHSIKSKFTGIKRFVVPFENSLKVKLYHGSKDPFIAKEDILRISRLFESFKLFENAYQGHFPQGDSKFINEWLQSKKSQVI